MGKWTQLYRKRIWLRDGQRCSYCLKSLTFSTSTLDHVIPMSQGGRNTKENLVIACESCNSEKGSIDEEDFRMLFDFPLSPEQKSRKLQSVRAKAQNREKKLRKKYIQHPVAKLCLLNSARIKPEHREALIEYAARS